MGVITGITVAWGCALVSSIAVAVPLLLPYTETDFGPGGFASKFTVYLEALIGSTAVTAAFTCIACQLVPGVQRLRPKTKLGTFIWCLCGGLLPVTVLVASTLVHGFFGLCFAGYLAAC